MPVLVMVCRYCSWKSRFERLCSKRALQRDAAASNDAVSVSCAAGRALVRSTSAATRAPARRIGESLQIIDRLALGIIRGATGVVTFRGIQARFDNRGFQTRARVLARRAVHTVQRTPRQQLARLCVTRHAACDGVGGPAGHL